LGKIAVPTPETPVRVTSDTSIRAHRIRFANPSGGGQVTVEAPLAPELEAWINGLL
jgi:hypothetical protein